jgi:nitric oxide dioxygenase
MLTEAQKKIIRQTYVHIARREYSTGEMFYERLFAIAPELRGMFPNDMTQMRLKFIQMVGSYVKALEIGENYNPVIEKLGKKHVNYGVKPEHYDLFRQAFLWAIRQTLDEYYSLEVEEAWAALYDMMALIAIGGTHESR